jgi:hypothetical protein
MNISNDDSSSMNSIQYGQSLMNSALFRSRQRISKNSDHRSRKLALVLAGVITFSPVAKASLLPGMEVFNNMQEVSDAELGHMRGKFASNNQVMYFGVEMVSQWQTATGSLVTAGANLNINMTGNTPTVQYAPTVTIVQQGQSVNPPQSGGTNVVAGGGSLANVTGVSQSIQVAGQSNTIHNGIDMQVYPAFGQGGGTLLAGAMQGQAGSVSATGNDGSVATVTLANNSVGVNVIVPGQGEVLQQIRNQGVFQSARIGGDLNQIYSTITMHIGLNMGGGSGTSSALAALQSLKSLPRNGMF